MKFMQCSFPRQITNGDRSFYVACGQCICCRINKTTEWSIRLLMEMKNWNNASFVTLTYNDEHLPEDYSLHKADLQKFIKRLRKRLGDRRIKYYACGEYGDNPRNILPSGFGRPHFHIILFGLDPNNEEDREDIADSWSFSDRFFFDRKHEGIGSVNSDSIQYVTGYIRKKLIGSLAEDYENAGLLPPFQLCSQGLGFEGFKEYYDEYNHPDKVFFRGHEISIPRYFREKLGIDTSSQVAKCREDMIQALLKFGYSIDELRSMNSHFLKNGANQLEVTYYEKMRPYLEQNHENKKQYLTMKNRRNKI